MIDKDVRSHLMFGMAVLVVAMLTFGACLLMEADGSDADSASVERGGSTTVPISALFSPSQISQLAECDSWTGGGATPSIYTTWNSGSISIEPEGPNVKITASSQVEPGSHLVTIYGFEEGMDHQLFTVPVEVTGTTGHTQSSALDSVDYVMRGYPAGSDPTALHSPVYVREGAAVSYRLCMQSYDPVAYLTATGSSAHQSSIGGLSVSVNSSHHAVLAGTMGSEEVTLHVIYGARNYQVTFAPVLAPLTPIQILSTGGTAALIHVPYTYEIQTVPSDTTITLTGNASETLHVEDHTITGTFNAVGSYILKITAKKENFQEATQTLTIIVSDTPAGDPTIDGVSYTIDSTNPKHYHFTANGVTNGTVTFDFGDGTRGSGNPVDHTYATSGIYNVQASVTNGTTTVSAAVRIMIGDAAPPATAVFRQLYTYTLVTDTVGKTVSLDGDCPFLSKDVQPDHITISGTPTSTAYVGKTYSVVLRIGPDYHKDWTITVQPGHGAGPVASFECIIEGLKVTVTNTSVGADQTYYRWEDGSQYVLSNARTVSHTYAEAGTFTITQRVTAVVNGSTLSDTSSRTVTVSDPGITPPATHGIDPSTIAAIALVIIGVLILVAALWLMMPLAAFIGVLVGVAGAVMFYLMRGRLIWNTGTPGGP